MDLELVSFKICPFVQRAVITLRYKNVPFRVTHIDLSVPPDWFNRISPFGKVPLLKVDGSQVIFESAVIDEYLDEITEGTLLPEDPLLRALNRSWIEFGTACLLDLSGLMHAEDAATFNSNRETLISKLKWLEDTLDQPPWFNGAQLSLVDFAYAPLFMRADLLNIAADLYPAEQFPKLAAWGQRLLELPAVQGSVVEDFPELLRDRIRTRAAYAAHQLGI